MSSGDLSEQLRWERRARELLQGISLAAAEATLVSGALGNALEAVCRHTGWPVGHALVLDGSGALVSARIWHLDDAARFARFREVTEASRFEPGVGLPGRVLAAGRPEWIRDVMADANFPRARLMQEASVHAAFACPVIVSGAVSAVLEFFATDVSEPDPPLLEVMAAIGAQLGRVIERTRSEEALRRSELRFRSVTETAHDAIITADAEGVIVSWNQAAERMFGWREEEAVGRSLTMIIPDRFHQAHLQGITRVRTGGARHAIGRTVELDGRHKDGSELPLELSLATWSLGEQRFFTGILRDIRERRQAAARLAESERRAIEASGAKTVFLANMSHELRTPLNAILGFSQLLERDPAFNGTQRETLDIILRSGEHLLGLINDVLSMAKIESGRLSLAVEELDPARLIDELGELFRRRAQARGLAFEVVAESLPRAARGDAGKLRQVLFNLLGNAVKFTSDGKIVLRAAYRDGRAAFSVEDSGPGIAPDDQPRIFEPFVQSSSSGSIEGTGLGLAISRDFVRLLGGTLALESAPGRGTRFSFDIPLEIADSPVERTGPRRVVGLETGEPERRLLVVDNDADSRLLLMRLLSSVGFAPREAADGQRALELCEEWRPHLVWMDIRMPVLDGLEATRRLRAREAADPARPRTVVIALTASAFDHDRAQILDAGCDAVLTKPFREATIFDALSQHLGVRFRYEQPTEPPMAFDATRIARLPAELRQKLREALIDGDEEAARAAVEKLGDAELVRMIKQFQFDELLTLLERAS